MSAWWQFKALIRKNMQTLKRSIFMTLMEIFYPIILMIICYLIKLAFDSTKVTWEEEGGLDNYLISKGNFGFDYQVYPYLTVFSQLLENSPDVTGTIFSIFYIRIVIILNSIYMEKQMLRI